MTITLYTFKGDNRELAKALLNPIEIENVQLLEPTNLTTPSLKLLVANYSPSCNYLYIPDFERYYYISDVRYELGGYITLSLRCDVLMSFAVDIKGTSGLINRAGYYANVLVSDSAQMPQCDTSTVNKLLTGGELVTSMSGLNRCFVLSVYGG